jgi:hypothetical protein
MELGRLERVIVVTVIVIMSSLLIGSEVKCQLTVVKGEKCT